MWGEIASHGASDHSVPPPITVEVTDSDSDGNGDGDGVIQVCKLLTNNRSGKTKCPDAQLLC